MAFRSVNFWKNLSERWSVHVLLTHQRPGNQLVILRGVSREWYLFEKDRGNEETTVVVWSWVDIILRTCSCSLLRLSKQSYVGFHMARDEGRPLATSSLAVGRFGAKKGSLRSPRGRLVASLLLTQNKEKRRESFFQFLLWGRCQTEHTWTMCGLFCALCAEQDRELVLKRALVC